jgi:HAMP domain-containing protein
MKRISFRTKLSVAFILLTVSALLVNTYLVYEISIRRQKAELRGRILSLAKTSSIFINADKLMQIKPELASQGTDLYKETKDILKNVRSADSLIDSVYIMIPSSKEYSWIFLVDSGDKRKFSAYCGEYYDVSKFPEMRQAFQGPIVDNEITQDKWGSFLSGYAPLYNSQGKAVAIVGIDVRSESIRNMQLMLEKRFTLALLLGLLFSLFMGWFMARGITRPLRILTQRVKEVGEGKLDKKVGLKSRDELGELADAFNKMIEELRQARINLERYYLNTIHALARAIESKDPYTKGHSERVAQYAVGLARYLKFPKNEIILLEEACILHDIGKIGIPESILTKPAPLTEEEWKVMKTHPQEGKDILKFIEFLRPGLSIVCDHHERPDGRGYPHGLTADKISRLVSIVSIADSFDAMTSDRSYRKAFPRDEAFRRLRDSKDKQFNAEMVEAFILSLRDAL